MSDDEQERIDELDDDEIEIVEVVGMDDVDRPAGIAPADEVEVRFDDEGAGPRRPPSDERGVPPEGAMPPGTPEREQILRLRAEFENLQKRFEREREETIRHANSDLVSSLLPVIDNLERALMSQASDADGGSFRDGVSLIHRQLIDALQKAGLRPVDAVGKTFDPTLHEAMATDDSGNHAPNIVIEELQRGYLFRNRLIRPSLVRVAVAPGHEKREAAGYDDEDNEPRVGES
jgi:molecular chaperone GrpE